MDTKDNLKERDYSVARHLFKVCCDENHTRPTAIQGQLFLQSYPEKFFPTWLERSKQAVLIYKSLKKETTDQSKQSLDNSIIEELEGSPLELQKFAKLSATDEDDNLPVGKQDFQPLPLHTARLLLSDLCSHLHKVDGPCSLPVIWIFCDGEDPGNIVALGAELSLSNNVVTSTLHKITSSGPLTKETLPNMRDEIKQAGHGRFEGKVECSATYEILSATSYDESITTPQGSLTVTVQWSTNNCSLFSTPMSTATQAQVLATVAVGDMRSAAFTMYSDLEGLQCLHKGLNGSIQWLRSTDTNEKSPPERLEKLLKDMQRGSLQQLSGTEADNLTQEPFALLNSLVLVSRKDLDFPDRLWDILKDCTSYDELISCWKEVFAALQSGQVQPMVHKSKKSTLAQCIRASYFNQMTVPSLRGTVPLRLLVEIGVEKLQLDYVNNFVGKELTTAAQMNYYLCPGEHLDEQMARLGKLHCALELVVMLEQYLNLPHHILGSAGRKALQQFESKEYTPCAVFTIPVEPRAVLPIVTRFEAKEWKAEVADVSAKSKIAIRLSGSNPFGNTNSDVLNETHEESTPLYMLTHFTETLQA